MAPELLVFQSTWQVSVHQGHAWHVLQANVGLASVGVGSPVGAIDAVDIELSASSESMASGWGGKGNGPGCSDVERPQSAPACPADGVRLQVTPLEHLT